MPLPLGYVDIHLGISSTSPQRLTFPLSVYVPADPVNEPSPDFFTLLGSNSFDVLPDAGTDLNIGAIVLTNDDTGQTVDFVVAPSDGFKDAEIRIFLNTSFLTVDVDYASHPTPKRGESLIVVGVRSDKTTAMRPFSASLGVLKGTAADRTEDVTRIQVLGPFGETRHLVIGRLRQPTINDTFTSNGVSYRRAVDGDAEGLLMELDVHDPTAVDNRWITVDITQPRAGDGPVQPPATIAGGGTGPGDIPADGLRQYQVTWVQADGNETAPSPPSAPTASLGGHISVPLPIWIDPLEPSLGGGVVVPEPVVARRVYRTVTSATGTAGEAALVHEIGNNTDDVWIDDRSDDLLGEPLLTKLQVRYRHSADQEGDQLANGFATFGGRLTTNSYEETTTGDRRLAGTIYPVVLHSVPPSADITFTTRAADGSPRVTWTSAARTGPAGIGSGTVDVVPTGTQVPRSSFVSAAITALPAAFGIDWFTRGATRTKVEVGRFDDTTIALDGGVGGLRLASASQPIAAPATSPRTANIDATPESMTASVRGIRRLRLLVGLPRPNEPKNAELDDGIVVELELDPARSQPRSLRLRSETVDEHGRSRVMVRVGDLPDRLVLDARPGTDFRSTELALTGRLKRVLVLVQDAASLAAGLPGAGRRRDGTWLALTDTGRSLLASIENTKVTVTPSAELRADLSLRSSVGLGDETFLIHQAQASVSTGSPVTFDRPGNGAASATVDGGVTGRVSISTRRFEPAQPDHLVAVRATPQVKVALEDHKGERSIDDLTARVLGLTGFSMPAKDSEAPFAVSLTDRRANAAARVHATLLDADRVSDTAWDLAKIRIVDLPESLSLLASTATDSYHLTLGRRSGRVVVFARPSIVPSDGTAVDEVVGIGLAEADIDALPTDVQIDLLGPKNAQRSTPFNATPPSDWQPSGFRIKSDGDLVARGLQLVSVGRIRPTPREYFWSNVAASLIHVTSDSSDAPGAVWLWTPSAPPPAADASIDDWSSVSSWLGFRIEDPALVTLQIQSYSDQTSVEGRQWNDPQFNWLEKAELQMQDYRGEVTVDADLSPEGDDDTGPGLWYLRSTDGGPFGGQVVFGNTGGWISNRPRIFDSFVL